MKLSELMIVAVVMLTTCDGRKTVDLTHTFDEDATKWPVESMTNETFNYYRLLKITRDYFGKGWWAMNTVEFYEHMGTHIDAPFHASFNGQRMHEIPAERLVGPGIVIDVKEKVEANPLYAVTVEDIHKFEDHCGRIPSNAIVIMNSGWGLKYPKANQVFGTDHPENSSTFKFPGWHIDACKFLLEKRQVGSVGVDTPSTDPGDSTTFPCHRYLQPNQVPLIEYVANLDNIPCNGTTIVLGAIKTRGGTGGPTRVLALIDDKNMDTTGKAATNALSTCVYFIATLLSFRSVFII